MAEPGNPLEIPKKCFKKLGLGQKLGTVGYPETHNFF